MEFGRFYLAFRFLLITSCHCFASGDILTQIPHPLTDRETINYSDNAITAVDYLEPMPLLRSFYLNRNGLTEFPDFANNTGILRIFLAHNNIAWIPIELLNILTKLKILYLRDNKLSHFPDAPGLVSLTNLAIGRNEFSEFPTFPNLGRSLQILYMKYNSISSLSYKKLAYLRRLKKLWVSFNQLEGRLPEIGAISGATLVIFKSNVLTEFDGRVVANFANNFTLDLGRNRISGTRNMFYLYDVNRSATVTINLDDNVIVCDCHVKWLKQAHEFGNVEITDAVCGFPADKRGRNLRTIPMSDLVCGEWSMLWFFSSDERRQRIIGSNFRRSLFRQSVG